MRRLFAIISAAVAVNASGALFQETFDTSASVNWAHGTYAVNPSLQWGADRSGDALSGSLEVTADMTTEDVYHVLLLKVWPGVSYAGPVMLSMDLRANLVSPPESTTPTPQFNAQLLLGPPSTPTFSYLQLNPQAYPDWSHVSVQIPGGVLAPDIPIDVWFLWHKAWGDPLASATLWIDNVKIEAVPVPEPTTVISGALAALSCGLGLMSRMRRRRSA